MGEATEARGVDHHQRLAGERRTQVDTFLAAQLLQLTLQQRRAFSSLRLRNTGA